MATSHVADAEMRDLLLEAIPALRAFAGSLIRDRSLRHELTMFHVFFTINLRK